MTERRGQDVLIEDLLTGDAPDPELLVRYADDPASLDEAERAEIEAQLAASPRARAALSSLQRFDPALLAAPAAASAERPQPEGPGVLARLREWLASWSEVPIWIPAGAAAAAALMLALWIDRGGPAAPEGPQIARAPAPAELREPAPELAPPPSEPSPARSPDPGASGTPQGGPPEVPANRLTDRLPVEMPPGAQSPAPQEAEPATRREPEPDVAPEPEPEFEAPVYVAMLEPTYATPFDIDPRERRASYVRGASGPGRLVALAPEHVARTARGAPVLMWWVERAEAGEWWLAVSDPQAFEPLARVRLPAPTASGVQSVDLADHGIELEPGVDYQWSVAHRIDPRDPSLDVVAQAWIRRVARPGAAADVAGHERAAALAAAGLWYDALAEIEARHRAHPDAAAPTGSLRRMLAAAGLGELDPGPSW